MGRAGQFIINFWYWKNGNSMRRLNLFLYEWKHFIRSPFKIVAILIFTLAGVYGLNKGSELYFTQTSEIDKIEEVVAEDRGKIVDEHYKKGILSNEERPWIDYSVPYWALRSASIYHFKAPSASMVYSIGQSEQFGFYKQIHFWASPYDADLAEEIANPERLQTGTLDFSFTLLFLMPLVLLILLYNIKSAESEQGILPLIEVQYPSKYSWLLSRMSFYVLLLFLIVLALLVYGAFLTGVLEENAYVLGQMLFYASVNLLFWSVLFFLVLSKSDSVLGTTLRMSAIYLVFAFIIPASVHQVLSIRYPVNMMTDLIDVREQRDALYNEADTTIQAKLDVLYPGLVDTKVYLEGTDVDYARGRSTLALVNSLRKSSIEKVEQENEAKNQFIKATFWFNPVSFFQNKFNSIAQTHYDDYQQYRDNIQLKVDDHLKMMVLDTWNAVKVDEGRFTEYTQL